MFLSIAYSPLNLRMFHLLSSCVDKTTAVCMFSLHKNYISMDTLLLRRGHRVYDHLMVSKLCPLWVDSQNKKNETLDTDHTVVVSLALALL